MGGSLVSQILTDKSTLTSGQIKSIAYDEALHRSSDLVLTKACCDYLFSGTVNSATMVTCEFGVITKPISEGVPVAGDLTNEKYMIGKTHKRCNAVWNTSGIQIDALHFEVNLKIKIPLDWQIFQVVANDTDALTNAFAYLVRLFWILI